MLSVRDTGIGIPAEQLPRLFERFHRVQGARSRTHEGTGIGLALVQELVKLHGGTVTVESAVGQGTTFTVAIPFGTAHLPRTASRRRPSLVADRRGAEPFVQEALRWSARRRRRPSRRRPAADGRGRRRAILLADDNADMRDYVARLLRRHWTVEAVADGDAALARAARRRRPDLILSDVMMPGLDGFGCSRPCAPTSARAASR